MQYPLVNGHRFSFASAEIRYNGARLMGITSIDYKNTLEAGEARGNHAIRYGTTQGELKSDGSMEMLKEEADEFIRQLGDGYLEKRFQIVVSYAEEGQQTKVDTLVNVRLGEDAQSHSQGTDALKVKFTLNMDYVLRNGKSPVKKTKF